LRRAGESEITAGKKIGIVSKETEDNKECSCVRGSFDLIR